MERPGSGRRRVRSGAVRATEIIDRAGRRFPRAQPRHADAPTAELSAVPAADPPSRGMRAAKLVGLALAAMTLCGTVGTAAMVARERGGAVGADAAGPITGRRALLPDDLTAAGSALPPAPAAPPTTAASTAIVAGPPEPTGDQGTTPADGSSRPVSTAGMSDDELVAEYYRLVRSDPGNAFGLLSAAEFGADLGQFLNAWSAVTDVRVVDIESTGEGVLADVRMLLATGQTLWVRQLFRVTESTPRRIAGVTLLSAQVG
ncbi:hypothetical protein [Actinokineospora sp. NPDC004072]